MLSIFFHSFGQNYIICQHKCKKYVKKNFSKLSKYYNTNGDKKIWIEISIGLGVLFVENEIIKFSKSKFRYLFKFY